MSTARLSSAPASSTTSCSASAAAAARRTPSSRSRTPTWRATRSGSPPSARATTSTRPAATRRPPPSRRARRRSPASRARPCRRSSTGRKRAARRGCAPSRTLTTDHVRAAAAGTGAVDIAVAESFLVHDGRVRGFDLHARRFDRGCAEAGVRPERSLAAAAADLTRTGRWFPRVDVSSRGEVAVAVRPAPAREPSVVAWLFDGPDPRRAPRRKGPDLARLGALRAEAVRRGAGEALLGDGDGRLLEGAYTSLMWWEGAVLWAVPDDAPILDGVTRRLLLDLAAGQGVEVRYRRPAPAELDGCEVWLTSALHGIRAVTASAAPGCLRAGPARRAAAWQARLEALAAPLGDATAR